MVSFPENAGPLLASIDATNADWQSAAERLRQCLAVLNADEYLVDGSAVHDRDDRPWVRFLAVGVATVDRWDEFLTARRTSYREALAVLPEVKSALSLLPRTEIRDQVEQYRAQLWARSDPRLQAVALRTIAGRAPDEAAWVLDVPQELERDMLWLWAAVDLMRE